MAENIYILTGGQSPTSALVVSQLNTSPSGKQIGDRTRGDNRKYNIFLVDGTGNFDARSGASGYSIQIGIGPRGATPTGGTFTLSDGTATTSTITFNASAATVQAALMALHSGAGPYNAAVTVSGAFPNYLIDWTTVGSHAALICDGSQLTPNAGGTVSRVQIGSGSLIEKQMLVIREVPAAFQNSFTTITNGWSGYLSTKTPDILELIAASGADHVNSIFEVQITDSLGNIDVLLATSVTIWEKVIDDAALIPSNLPSYFTTTQALAAFVQCAAEVTGFTGGGTNLDGIATAGGAAAVGWKLAPTISGLLYIYELVTGTDATSSPNVIRPADYDGSTNAVVWKLRGLSIPGLHSDETITAISGAGNSNVTLPAQSLHHVAYLSVTETYDGTAFTATVTLLTTNAVKGCIAELKTTFSASDDCTLEIHNASSSGTLLTTFRGAMYARNAWGRYEYDGTKWNEVIAGYRNVETNTGNAVPLGTITFNATQVIDFDGPAVQVLALTADVTFSTKNRAASGQAKTVTVQLTSASTRAIAFSSGMMGSNKPTQLTAGDEAILTLTSFGANESNTRFAYAIMS